jgi:hypothetical protein
MKSLKEEGTIWLHFGGPFVIWLSMLFFSNHLQIDIEALKQVPDAISLYAIFYFIFTRWAWKWVVFKGWLVKVPYIQGTWEGTFESTWKNDQGQTMGPTKMILVVKQTFSSISCLAYTKESSSYSTTAQINEDDDSGVFRLSYNYTNRSKASIRDRSQIHDGAAVLQIFENPTRGLEGEYWTNRKTTGDMKLRFKTKKLLQGFPNND